MRSLLSSDPFHCGSLPQTHVSRSIFLLVSWLTLSSCDSQEQWSSAALAEQPPTCATHSDDGYDYTVEPTKDEMDAFENECINGRGHFAFTPFRRFCSEIYQEVEAMFSGVMVNYSSGTKRYFDHVGRFYDKYYGTHSISIGARGLPNRIVLSSYWGFEQGLILQKFVNAAMTKDFLGSNRTPTLLRDFCEDRYFKNVMVRVKKLIEAKCPEVGPYNKIAPSADTSDQLSDAIP